MTESKLDNSIYFSPMAHSILEVLKEKEQEMDRIKRKIFNILEDFKTISSMASEEKNTEIMILKENIMKEVESKENYHGR